MPFQRTQAQRQQHLAQCFCFKSRLDRTLYLEFQTTKQVTGSLLTQVDPEDLKSLCDAICVLLTHPSTYQLGPGWKEETGIPSILMIRPTWLNLKLTHHYDLSQSQPSRTNIVRLWPSPSWSSLLHAAMRSGG